MASTLFNEDGTVTISKKKYERLTKSDNELTALHNWGVDSWDGYGEAMAELYPEDDEDEDTED